jgi:isocitrate dehydrogenase kinase/phosphatase
MWEYFTGTICILTGVYLRLVPMRKFHETEASHEYWTNLRAQHPRLFRYGPPFLVVVGAIRIGAELFA